MASGVEGAHEAPGAGRGAVRAVGAYLRTFTSLGPNARRLLLANMCINIGVGVFAVLFNLYLVELHHTLAYIGLVAAVTTVGQAAAAPLVSWAMRRARAHVVLAAGAGVMAVMLGLSALLTDATALAVVSALAGAALAVATIPASPYMMTQATARQRSHLFSAYFASITVGTMIGSLLSGAIPALAGAILVTHAHDTILEDRIGLIVGAAATGLGMWLFRSMSRKEAVMDEPDRPVQPSEEDNGEAHLRGDVLMMLAATAVVALTLGATLPFFNVYFATRLHASTGTIGTIYALSGVICTVAAFLAPAVGRWGRLGGFSVTRLLTAPIFVLFWLHPGLALAAAAYIGRNTLGTISGALENTFGMEVLPARLRNTVASWRVFAFNAGWTVGSLAAGVVVARLGYDVIFIAGGVLTVAGAAAYFARFAR